MALNLFSSIFGTPTRRTYTGRHHTNTVQRQAVGRGRSNARWPGQTTPFIPRGRPHVNARTELAHRGGGNIFSGYGRFAGVRHFGWGTRPTYGK